MFFTSDVRYSVALIIAILLAVFVYLVRIEGLLYLVEENQWMEHIQLSFIVIAGLLFWRNSNHKLLQNNKDLHEPVQKLALLAAILCFSFLVREMSVKNSGLEWLIFLVDGTGYKLLMLALWIPALAMLVRSWNTYWQIAKASLLSVTARFVALAALLLMAGALYDKEIIVVEYFRFYEEILEMSAYGALILAAMSYRQDMAALATQPDCMLRQNVQATNPVESSAI